MKRRNVKFHLNADFQRSVFLSATLTRMSVNNNKADESITRQVADYVLHACLATLRKLEMCSACEKCSTTGSRSSVCEKYSTFSATLNTILSLRDKLRREGVTRAISYATCLATTLVSVAGRNCLL